MSAPIDVAPRPTLDRAHLADHQLEVLRGLLVEALAAQREHHDRNALESESDGTIDDRELARVAAERAGDAIEEIEAALGRLAAGTYGRCESCDRPIPFERLEAIPEARYCVGCPRTSRALRWTTS